MPIQRKGTTNKQGAKKTAVTSATTANKQKATKKPNAKKTETAQKITPVKNKTTKDTKMLPKKKYPRHRANNKPDTSGKILAVYDKYREYILAAYNKRKGQAQAVENEDAEQLTLDDVQVRPTTADYDDTDKSDKEIIHSFVSKTTDIPYDVLKEWAEGQRKLPEYVATLVDKTLARRFPLNNGDLFCFMTNKQLANVLEYLRDAGLDTDGERVFLPNNLRELPKRLAETTYIDRFDELIMSGKCTRRDVYDYPFSDDATDLASEAKKFYNSITLTCPELEQVTGISRHSLANWLCKSHTPPLYILKYIYREAVDQLKQIENNADAIRAMNNKELGEFLTNVLDTAVKTAGGRAELGAFEDIDKYLEGTELLKPNIYRI